jgi:hypothetical protein
VNDQVSDDNHMTGDCARNVAFPHTSTMECCAFASSAAMYCWSLASNACGRKPHIDFNLLFKCGSELFYFLRAHHIIAKMLVTLAVALGHNNNVDHISFVGISSFVLDLFNKLGFSVIGSIKL